MQMTGAKGGWSPVARTFGGSSTSLATLFAGLLSLSGIALVSMFKFRTANNSTAVNEFPCWAAGSHSTSGVYKCGIQDGLNHTIAARGELRMAAHPNYNSPWFYAPSKLSLCWIPKVGCSKTKLVFAHLTGVINEPHIHRHSPPSLAIGKLSVDDLNHIFSADDWLNIVVVRDPMERFISGYLDKVWNTGWFNPGRRNYNLTAQSVLKFLKQDKAMHSDHFAPQSEYCGLRSLGPAWNRLVIYSRFGMEAKLSEASDGRLDSVLYGPGDLPSARPVFTGTTKHETKTSSEYQTLMKDLCCTDLGHRALHEIAVFFEEDYDRFPFPTRSVWGTGGMCDAVACPER